MIITFKKGENKQLSNHFNSSEFECPCSACKDKEQYIDEELISKLEEVRVEYGSGIVINSGYRCPSHNKKIGGKENSSHMKGLAADPSPARKTLDDLDLLYELCFNKFDNIGDGRKKGFVHVDTRPNKSTGKRHWIY
jgi:uncharacterized protein YcbK (DUF882 family)